MNSQGPYYEEFVPRLLFVCVSVSRGEKEQGRITRSVSLQSAEVQWCHRVCLRPSLLSR